MPSKILSFLNQLIQESSTSWLFWQFSCLFSPIGSWCRQIPFFNEAFFKVTKTTIFGFLKIQKSFWTSTAAFQNLAIWGFYSRIRRFIEFICKFVRNNKKIDAIGHSCKSGYAVTGLSAFRQICFSATVFGQICFWATVLEQICLWATAFEQPSNFGKNEIFQWFFRNQSMKE